MSEQDIKIEDDMVVSLEFTLRVEDELVDHTEPNHPIQFIQGLGQVVSGLEDALYGMRVGESKEITIPPEDAYGEEDEEAYAEIPKSEFPEDIPLELGVELILQDDEGEELEAYIVEIDEDTVLLDLNHPLAGEELHFSIKVVDIRKATEEELLHGHVHHN